MKNQLKRLLILCFAVCLIFHQTAECLAVQNNGVSMAFTDSKEKKETDKRTKELPDGEEEPSSSEDEKQTEKESSLSSDKKQTEEGSSQQHIEKYENPQLPDETIIKDGGGIKDEKSGWEVKNGKETTETRSSEKDSPVLDGLKDAKKEEKEKERQKAARSEIALLADNGFNMPKATYETFILQGKNGKGQKIGDSGKVTMLPSREAVQKDITQKHKDYVSFTPHWGTDSAASLSSQSGSRHVNFYVNDPKKAEHVGGIGQANMSPNIIGGRVFLLDNSMKNKLSCTYTNVGRYYDRSTGKSYGIDLRAVLVNFTKKPTATADVQNAIKDGALNKKGGALFCFTGKKSIGVLTSFCDSVTVRYEFFIHGTRTPIQLKGFARFADVDAQQGIEFSSSADYFYAVSEANKYLGYSKGVYTAGNKAYIYALSSAAYNEGEGHTFYTLFSGSQMTLRYTFAKCSRKDDGGSKNGKGLKKYKVPFDNSDVKHYSSSASRGYMHFDARQPYLAQPEIEKTVFNGNDIQKEIETPGSAVLNTLPDLETPFTYKVRTVCPYEDASEHHYDSWMIKDRISPFFKVDQAVVYDGTGKRSSDFTITVQEQSDGSVLVTAAAKNPAAQAFYEKNWYDLYITVRVRSLEELERKNLSFSGQYKKSGAQIGKYTVGNKAALTAEKEYTSNETETILPQWIKIKKVNQEGKPIKGITFGIFEKQDAVAEQDEPLMTAVTGEDGIAHFKSVSFFALAGKTGPYYIKEIARGQFENVYLPDENWYCSFSCDSGNEMIYGSGEEKTVPVLKNTSKILKKHTVIVRKKNRETADFLKGAVFSLYQWSEQGNSFMKLCDLEETQDALGQVCYWNPEDFISTEDNMGLFMIKEEKAPYGCYNSGKQWTFSTTDAYAEDDKAIEFIYTSGSGNKKTQTGELIYENILQKGILHIEKTDETGNLVKGAAFTIKAAEDIYAPWQYDENGNIYKKQEPLVPKGMICGNLTTNEEGKAVSDPLYIGAYQVSETGGAPEHIMSEKIYEVKFEYPEKDDIKQVEKTLQAGNVTMRPAFAVSKLAERTRNPEGQTVTFHKDTGRYTDTKVPGIYGAGETVRCRITVTNTGNVDLYNIRLQESLSEKNSRGQKLEEYVDKEHASFVIPPSGNCQSEKGNTVKCSLTDAGGKIILLNKLSTGDSVTVFFETKILDSSANVYNLINKVSGTASYDNNGERPGQNLVPVNTEELKDEEGNFLTKDEDSIHIPGKPDDAVVKIADRTTGCKVTNGELSGTKVPGMYYEGDTVRFTIYIKNTGTANLKNIIVTDIASPELREVIDEKSASFRLEQKSSETSEDKEESGKNNAEKKTMRTVSGKEITARLLDNDRVLLCENTEPETGEGCLLPGDTAVLYYYATVKQGAANFYDLKNRAVVSASYFTGEKEEQIPEKEDEDLIELPGVPEAKIAKIADRTTGAILKDGRYQNEKIAGVYENGNKIVYTITVTNSGSADLYDLKVKDIMESRLLEALDQKSVSFYKGPYKTANNNKIKSTLKSGTEIILDCLKAGDSVNLLLYATVNEKAGDLSKLENKVYVTGHYRKGNEQYQTAYEKEIQVSGFTYQLQYYANNGTAEKVRDSETPAHKGDKVHINGNPFKKDNAVFLGWNTKTDGTGKDYAPGAELVMPAQDVHLYARWGQKSDVLKKLYTYSLTYHSNNPAAQTRPDSETRCLGGTAVILDENEFIYNGYQFIGWSFTPEDKLNVLKPGDTYRMPKKDVHLYAQWKKEEKAALVYCSNIPGQKQEKTDFQTPCKKGTEITIKQCEFEREDYVFLGWSTIEKGQEPEVMPGDKYILKENTKLYAVWEREQDGREKFKYRLTYHGNNETDAAFLDNESPCEEGTSIILDGNSFQYPGYVFLGWNTKADGTGKDWMEKSVYTMPDRNVHLYAKWKKAAEYTLTYRSNYPGKKETVRDEQRIDSETPCLEYSAVKIDGCTFQCDGYTFMGWSLSPDAGEALIMPEDSYTMAEDTVLYAVWTDEYEEYTLLYSSNTETDIWEAAPESPSPAGTPQTLITNPFYNRSASFVGWSLDKEAEIGSENILSPGRRFEQPAKDTVLYAIWKPEKSYCLYYDGNGAVQAKEDTVEDGRLLDEETPSTAGSIVTLDASPFKKDGYLFLGWSEKASDPVQIDIGVKKSAGKTENNSERWEKQLEKLNVIYPGCAYKIPDKDTVLYAVWGIESKEKNLEKEFYENGGEMAASAYTPIPVTQLMKDQDHINIPGSPNLRIAKKADKTKGVQLKEGRYRGKRKPGVYYQGDTVIYTITVSNYGTSAARHIKIKETPSDIWKNVMEAKGFTASEKEILKTVRGNLARVEKKTKKILVLDNLEAGDKITITFEAEVKVKQALKSDVKNTVKVSGKKKDGADIPETKYMKDSDTIRVTVKTQNGSSNHIPKTGDNTPVFPFFIVGVSALLVAGMVLLYKKDRKSKMQKNKKI